MAKKLLSLPLCLGLRGVYFTHFKFQFHSRIYGHKNGGMSILWPLPLTDKRTLSDF